MVALSGTPPSAPALLKSSVAANSFLSGVSSSNLTTFETRPTSLLCTVLFFKRLLSQVQKKLAFNRMCFPSKLHSPIDLTSPYILVRHLLSTVVRRSLCKVRLVTRLRRW